MKTTSSKKLLGAKGIATRSDRTLLAAPGLTTRSKDVTRSKGHSKCSCPHLFQVSYGRSCNAIFSLGRNLMRAVVHLCLSVFALDLSSFLSFLCRPFFLFRVFFL